MPLDVLDPFGKGTVDLSTTSTRVICPDNNCKYSRKFVETDATLHDAVKTRITRIRFLHLEHEAGRHYSV